MNTSKERRQIVLCIMSFLAGTALPIGVFTMLLVIRWRQFFRKFAECGRFYKEKTQYAIMLDHYRDSAELSKRLYSAYLFYFTLQKNHLAPIMLQTIGALNREARPIGILNLESLREVGIPDSKLKYYGGKNELGAADTFEEVRLACEYVKSRGQFTLHILCNHLQAFQAFYVCVFCGVLPRIHSLPLIEKNPQYVFAKLFQAILVLVDPLGRDPLSRYMRYRRRNISNKL